MSPISRIKSKPPVDSFTAHKKGRPPKKFAKDTTAPAEETAMLCEIPITKPLLPPPQRGILKSLDQIDAVGRMRLRMNSSLMDNHIAKLQEYAQQHQDLFKDSAIKTQDSLFWSGVRKTGAAILSAFSLLLGISLAGSSPIIAAALISSGVLAITNLALTESGTWDKIADYLYPENKPKREQFLRYAPLVVGILSAGLGLIGGATSWRNGAITFADKVVSAVNTSVGCAEGVASLAEGVTKGRALFAEAAVNELDIKMFLHQEQLTKFKSAFEEMISFLTDACNRTNQIINMSTEAVSEITLRG